MKGRVVEWEVVTVADVRRWQDEGRVVEFDGDRKLIRFLNETTLDNLYGQAELLGVIE